MDSCIYNTGGYCFNRSNWIEAKEFPMLWHVDFPECPWIGNEEECEYAEEC